MAKKWTINLYSDNSFQLEKEAPPEPPVEYIFTLADDYLPPSGMRGMTDTQLKNDPSVWPFDVFRKHRRHPKNINLPATVNTLKKENFTHSESMLIYWADNCALAWYDTYHFEELKNTEFWDAFVGKWQWLSKGTEVITNHKGVENGYYDPVTGQNKGNLPIGIDALVMERTVLRPVDTQRHRYGRTTGYMFYTLNGDEPAPNVEEVNYRTFPHLFSMANILMAPVQTDDMGRNYNYMPNGHLGLNPFPQGWSLGANTPLPNVSKAVAFGEYVMPGGINLVDENRVAHQPDGSVSITTTVPNPYNHIPVLDLR